MEAEIKNRTKRIGLEAITIAEQLPNKPAAWVIGKQLIRCATSVGANYRAACRAKSKADFVYKLRIVEEEADETIFWLEMLEESRLVQPKSTEKLQGEVNQILAIIVASVKTLKRRG